MFLVGLEYAILASTFTVAKTVLSYAKPFFTIGFRMTVAGVLLLGYQYIFNRSKFVIKKEDWWLFFKVSIFHVYLAFIPEFWALQYLSSSKTSLIYSATPFIAAILSYFLLSERLNKRKIFGMFVGILGLIPVLLTQTDTREAAMELFSISLPEVVLFGAVISAAYAWFILKELMKKGYSLPIINGVAMFAGGILSFATSFVAEGVSVSPVFSWGPFIGWVSLLIFLANIVSYNFYGWLLKRYSITFMTFAGFLCPIFAAFYGWFFLSEQITWHYFLSLLLITIGLYIFYKEEITVA